MNSNGSHQLAGPQLPCADVLKTAIAARRSLVSSNARSRGPDRFHNVVSMQAYQAEKRRRIEADATANARCRCMICNIALWLLLLIAFAGMGYVMQQEQKLMEQQLQQSLRP
jgi:hypothetical protein